MACPAARPVLERSVYAPCGDGRHHARRIADQHGASCRNRRDHAAARIMPARIEAGVAALKSATAAIFWRKGVMASVAVRRPDCTRPARPT